MKIDNKSFAILKRKAFEAYFAKLNDRQREAVFKTDGPLLVLAGAGSGKTTVLVNRIACIICFGNAYESDLVPENAAEIAARLESAMQSNDHIALRDALKQCAVAPAKPDEVLCLTFTNKAAGEFKERLGKLLGDDAQRIWAGTFHSVCVRILRRYINRLGYDNSFAIYDAEDSKKLITDIIKRICSSNDVIQPKAIMSAISRAKNNGMCPEAFADDIGTDERLRIISRVYTEYQKSLKSSNALDFDDIIMLTNELLSTDANVLAHYREQFKYILCDEYQDTNPAQSRLVYALAGDRHNICVVGDDDQSIYRFRGATVENILNFTDEYPEAKVVRLEQNYRSTGNILGAANSIISHNETRLGKSLWTSAEDGDPVAVKHQYTQSEEASYIMNCIRSKVTSGEYHYRDFAVLMRMNGQSNAIEIILSKSRVPYRVYGGVRFYERREIKDIIAYLSLLVNPADDTRLMRIINLPKRGIGQTTIDRVRELAVQHGMSMYEALKRSATLPDLHKAAPKLGAFVDIIEELKSDSASLPLDELINAVIKKTGYLDMLKEEEDGALREENLGELVSSAVMYLETTPEQEHTLASFLEDLALVSDVDDYNADDDAVTLMTVHSAKGLEFPVVFVPGFEEGMFPSSQSIGEPGGIEEERRLAYVAITRAKKQVVLLHTTTRLLYGKTTNNPPSRFIEEIDKKYVGDAETFSPVHTTESKRRYAASRDSFRQMTASVAAQKSDSASVYAEGDRVKHAVFGVGTVVKAEILSGDVLYEIDFDSVGNKRLMGNYAKLTKQEE